MEVTDEMIETAQKASGWMLTPSEARDVVQAVLDMLPEQPVSIKITARGLGGIFAAPVVLEDVTTGKVTGIGHPLNIEVERVR